MPRYALFCLLLATVACSSSPRVTPRPHSNSHPRPPVNPKPNVDPDPDAPSFLCTEVIGLTITAEWYSAGFEERVDDGRFQARTRPHTFVDQWADAAHEAWSEPVTSPCLEHADAPDRVVLFAANWKLASQAEWEQVLTAFVATARQRYPAARDIELFTVLRGPHNQSCGDPKSVVDPMIDAAIARVAERAPELVHGGPQLEASDCSVFEKGGPHFSEGGRKLVAQQLAKALR